MTQREIGILGFGNQAKAWAHNMKDSAWSVRILLRPDSHSAGEATRQQFETITLEEGLPTTQILAVLIPDDAMPAFFASYGHLFPKGQSLIFAHGFSLHYKTVPWPAGSDWILVAPKGIGSAVRERFLAGSGVPAVLDVQNDATGKAWERAESVAQGIGSSRAGLYRATVREEVEADLFSEQALLCGGLPALIAETYGVLVKNGIRPEVAYLECVHELAFMTELIQKKGLHEMLKFASPTARFGGIMGAKRLSSPSLRAELEKMYQDIHLGRFEKTLKQEANDGFRITNNAMEEIQKSALEKVGHSIRGSIQVGKES